jgi:hypothetical protein
MKYLIALAIVLTQAGAPQERVAALKQSLQQHQQRLRGYEWVETTIISLKGEEKARKQQRAYYGAEGKIQKILISESPQPQPDPAGGGGRGGGRLKKKIVENKKSEMHDYMEKAAALIHLYVPPDPNRIQTAKAADKLALSQPEPGRVRAGFVDFLQPGDEFAIDLNGANNSLAAIHVGTYLEKREDTVSLDVRYAALQDGTSYPAQTTFAAKAKNITVVIQNTGYRPLAK